MRFTYDIRHSAPRYEQVGVVSGGVGRCGDADIPGVYVRMADPEVNAFVRLISGLGLDGPEASTTTTTTTTTPKPPTRDDLSVRSNALPLSAISSNGDVVASLGYQEEDGKAMLNVNDLYKTTKIVTNQKLSQVIRGRVRRALNV